MAIKPKRKRSAQSRRRAKGGLPGEYMKRSLVSVSTGMLGDGGQVSGVNDLFPRVYEESYIVRTRRFEKQWSVDVEYKGETFIMPHKVITQIERHMRAILEAEKEDSRLEKSAQARERMKERIDDGLVPFQKREAI